MKTRIVTLFVLAITLLAVHPAAAQLPVLPQRPAGSAAEPAAVPAPGRPAGEAGPPAPAAPQAGLSFVGQFGGPIYRSTLVGTTLYLGGGTRLVVMDVSNPAAPTVVGQSADLGGEVGDIAIAGDYAYVGVGDVGIAILDVADPAHPVRVAAYYEEDLSFCNQITLHGNHAYVAGGYLGLLVLDTTNPLALVETSIYTTTSYVNSVVISGTTAYLGAGHTGLQMLDIADPAHPTYLGAYTRAGLSVEDVEVHGPYAYLAASDDGLLIVDITDPLSPTLVGEMPVGWNDVWGLTVSGDYAYLALEGYGLSIVDVSNPAAPGQTGAIHTRDNSAWDITLVGTYAYLTAYDDGLHVFDVANPAAPTLAYLYDIPSKPRDIAVAGNYAYLADGWDVLHSVDISNPASPVEGDLYYVAGGAANTLEVSGTLAYMGDGSGLHIIDISDPLSLTHMSSLVLLGGCEDMVVSGSYAYVEDFSVGGRWYENDHGWAQWSYQGEEYEILIRNTDSWAYSMVPLEGGLPRFALEADMRQAVGEVALYGLNFGQVDGNHLYNFRVYPAAQQYALLKLDGDTWTNLTGWAVSPAINDETGTNHLRVERDGEQIRLYANGVLLNSLADSSYLGNQEMSLYAGSWTEAPVAIRYDNVTFGELP